MYSLVCRYCVNYISISNQIKLLKHPLVRTGSCEEGDARSVYLVCSGLDPFPALRTPVTTSMAQSVTALDIFETGVTSIRWQKLFTETNQAFTVYMAIYTTTRGLLVQVNAWHRKDNDGIISALEPNVFSFCY